MSIGIVPSVNKTFELEGRMCENMEEGKLYFDDLTNLLFMYSTKYKRSCPDNGFFPIFDGKTMLFSKYSIEKYYPDDVINTSLDNISSCITDEKAKEIIYNRKVASTNSNLNPEIREGDNLFTQCIKSIICSMNINMIDLYNMNTNLSENIVENCYDSLIKIAFMRNHRWKIWINDILKLNYIIKVYKGNDIILECKYPDKMFQTKDIFKYITETLLKKLNIDKLDLQCNELDNYTINNMFSALKSRQLSAQIFSRFMVLMKLAYDIEFYKDKNLIFTYKQSRSEIEND